MRTIARHTVALLITLAVAGACRERTVPSTAPEPAPFGLNRDEVAGVIITELMADPFAVADDVGEYIEVFNPGSAPVDMQGWHIVSGPSGAETHTIGASFIVPACGVAVLVRAGQGNGGITNGYVYGTSITLNNSTTDFVVLRRADNSLVDSVSYSVRNADGTVGTPTFSPSSGISRVLVNPALDNTNIAGNTNWINTPTGSVYGLGDRGSPGVAGAAYAAACGTSQPAGPVATVTLSPATASIAIGATRALTASGADASGNPAPTTFTWTRGSDAVATVSTSGVVSGVAVGTTTISARSANGVTGTATVTVVPAAGAATVTVAINDPRELPVGFTKPAFPTVRDADNTVLTAVPLTWTTSDAAIATVDQLGYVTGVQPGTVTVRATAANGVTGANSITILPATASSSARYRSHLEFGVPTDATPADEQLIARTEFASSWNRTRGGPNWTSWNLNASQFGAAERCDCFSPDPLTPAPRIVDFDYRNSGYDRGHLVQSESRTATYQENAATFLLTNILPQAANNNQGPWLALENYLNDLARTGNKEIYVVAGGEYAPNAPSLKGEGRVLVPDYTWKVAIIRPAGTGLLGLGITDTDVQVIAARFPNRTESGIAASAATIRNTPWQSFQTTVDQIEAATGYDLLSSLPNDVEAALESGGVLGAQKTTAELVKTLSDALLSLARVRTMDKAEADALAKALQHGLDDLETKGPTALRAAVQTFVERIAKLPRSDMFTEAHASSWTATANGLLLRLQRAQ
ncbi:MAG: DNA/RNA non-specific endonuclease [Gemmatimonadota bacterium]